MGARWTDADLAKLKNATRAVRASPKVTANGLTRFVLNFLEVQGVEASRVNTMGVFDIKRAADLVVRWLNSGARLSLAEVLKGLKSCYRKSHERRGMPDVCGYHRKLGGVAVFVEVKVGRDELSPEQKFFLSQAKRAGAIALVARNEDQFVKDWAAEIARLV